MSRPHPSPERSKSVSKSMNMTRSMYFKDDDDLPEQTLERDQFESKWHALFFYIGNLVGPGNILKFPYCTLMNGGVVFMLMYTLAHVIVGIPVSFVEYSLGQYSGKSAVKAWDVAPALRGVGFSSCLMAMFMVIVDHVLMAYSALFAVNCFQHDLPWAVCKPAWNNCYSDFEDLQNLTYCTSTTQPTKDCICSATVKENCVAPPKHASMFYYSSVMMGFPETDSVSFGLPNWDLVLILIGSWTLFVCFSYNGVARNTSKILPLSVLGPYVFMTLLLIKAATQYGAVDGMVMLFQPKAEAWKHMINIKTWVLAVTLSLFSLSTGDGSLITYGSYNQFNDDPLRIVLTGAIVDFMSSLLCGVVVALVLGHFSHLSGDSFKLEDLSETSVLFAAFPAAMATYKWSNIWSFIFFFTCYLFAIDTEFAILETLMAYLQDDFAFIKHHTAKTRIFCCILFCLIDILLICEGGHGFRDLLDRYTEVALPIIISVEVIALMWIYGYKKWLADMEYMIGHRIGCNLYLFVHLNCLLPLLTFLSIVSMMVVHYIDHVPVPTSAQIVGHCLTCLIFLPILIWFFLHLYKFRTYRKNKQLPCKKFMAGLMKPHRRWGPHDGTNPRRDRHTVFADIFPRLRRKRPASKSVFKVASLHAVDFERELDYFFGPGASSVFLEKRFSQSLSVLEEIDESNVDRDPDLSMSVDTGRKGKHTSKGTAFKKTASSLGKSSSPGESTAVDPPQPAPAAGSDDYK